MVSKEFDKLSKKDKEKLIENIPEKDKEILKQKLEMLVKVIPILIMAKTDPNNITTIMRFGSISTEYCNKFNCSLMDFIKEVKVMEQVFFEKSIENGIGFDENVYDIPKPHKKKNQNNSTNTIGEILKSKNIDIKLKDVKK